MIQKRMYGIVIRHALMFSFLLTSFLLAFKQQIPVSTQNVVPVQRQGMVSQPITTPQQGATSFVSGSRPVMIQQQQYFPAAAITPQYSSASTSYVAPPATSLQRPTEAVMMSSNVSGLSLMPEGVIQIFKKASILVKQMRTNIRSIDQKRDNVRLILSETDRFLDNAYPNVLIKVGKLEGIFMSQSIKNGSKSK